MKKYVIHVFSILILLSGIYVPSDAQTISIGIRHGHPLLLVDITTQ
jgi:hypothetical protein